MDRKIPLIYDTLSDCINDPNIVGGMVVKTLGANAIDDGEGRVYKVYDPSMGVVYDREKHISLAKSGTFMGKIEDSPLYEGLRDANREIEILKTSSGISDLTHMERAYVNEEALKADERLAAGIVVKTVGMDEPGDGLGRTFLIVEHDPTEPFEKDEIQIFDWNLAAKVIDASYAESLTYENKDDIDIIKDTINSGVMLVFSSLEEFKASENVSTDMIVRTLGRTTMGDGLGATYKVYASESPWSETDIPLTPTNLWAYYIKENADEEASITEIAGQVSGLTTALSNTNERLEETRNDITSTNQTLNELRYYTYNNLNDLLFQINDPYISEWKHFRYFDVIKNPNTGEVISETFVVAFEAASNGIKHIVIPKYDYPGYFAGDTILGFYYDGNFYKDIGHYKPITPKAANSYIDLTPGEGNAQYNWNGSRYVKVIPPVYCYFYNGNPYEDAEHTQPITPVVGTIYVDIVRKDAHEYGGEGMWIEIDDPGLVNSGGGDIPDEKHLYKEVKREIEATVEVDGPIIEVDVNGYSADWIRPLVLDHFLPEEDPEPDDRPVVQGYYYNGIFYTNAAHEYEITPEEDTIYVDLTEGANSAKYVWMDDMFVLLEDDEESKMHYFENGAWIMLNSDAEYPVFATYTVTHEQYTDPDTGETETYDVPHYKFKITMAPENRVVYYV